MGGEYVEQVDDAPDADLQHDEGNVTQQSSADARELTGVQFEIKDFVGDPTKMVDNQSEDAQQNTEMIGNAQDTQNMGNQDENADLLQEQNMGQNQPDPYQDENADLLQEQ